MSDGRITAVVTPEGRWDRWDRGIERFEEVKRPGQMAMVPWIVAHKWDGGTIEFNVAQLVQIERAAQTETDDE